MELKATSFNTFTPRGQLRAIFKCVDGIMVKESGTYVAKKIAKVICKLHFLWALAFLCK